MPTREEQKEQRRLLIISKALELFVRKGYLETTISDIAKAADMSVGLMFHYFESKEQLYETLVKMGLDGTNMPKAWSADNPLAYFRGFLEALFAFAKEQPWVFYMFVLMSQARRNDSLPQHIKDIAMSVDQIEFSAGIIKAGQPEGYFRRGDPLTLSNAFWCSVQGIMEQHIVAPEIPFPETEWILDIIKGDM